MSELFDHNIMGLVFILPKNGLTMICLSVNIWFEGDKLMIFSLSFQLLCKNL